MSGVLVPLVFCPWSAANQAGAEVYRTACDEGRGEAGAVAVDRGLRDGPASGPIFVSVATALRHGPSFTRLAYDFGAGSATLVLVREPVLFCAS